MALEKALLYLKLYGNVDFLLAETPIFAYYELTLKSLQEKVEGSSFNGEGNVNVRESLCPILTKEQ